MNKTALYPLFLRLENQDVVVVGAGDVATRKVRSLLPTGASIRVVAPEFSDELMQLEQDGLIEGCHRTFSPDDVKGVRLVFCATDDPQVNREVFAAGAQQNVPVNVVDVPDLCDFYVPSTLRRGALQVAVSTSGAAPHMARNIRRGLEETFPEWWEPYLDLLAAVRLLIKERVPGPAYRRASLMEAVTGSDLEQRAAEGNLPDAEWVYQNRVEPLLDKEVAGSWQ